MNKLFIGVGVMLLVGAGWFLINSNTLSYVAVVDDEVSALENELVELETAVANGTITPEAALKAKAKIISRMEAINAAVLSADDTSLSLAQRKQLLSGLGRLKSALNTYANTLTSVDQIAEQADDKTKAKYKGGSRKVSTIISNTIAVVDEQAVAVIEDYADNFEEAIEMGEVTSGDIDEGGQGDSVFEAETIDADSTSETDTEITAELETEADVEFEETTTTATSS